MKKLIMSIIVDTICISLCACGQTKEDFDFQDKILMLQMKINIKEATLYLSDSNEVVIDSIYALESLDGEQWLACFQKALELVKNAKTRIANSIYSPNFISTQLEKLEENYEETIKLLLRCSKLSEEEIDKLIKLISDGIYKHILLIKVLYAFSYLYEIREFNQLPNDVAQSNLKDSWWKFGFSDDIQCQETIDEQELYLIWAKQYFYEFDKDKFLQELQDLMENDNLSSAECNQKWAELIENFI